MVECISAPLKRVFSVPQSHGSVPVTGTLTTDRQVLNYEVDDDGPSAPDGFDRGAGSVNDEACVEMVERIKRGDRAALEELYAIFSRGIRFYFCRHAGPRDVEDKVHDSFLIVVERIRRGELRDPRCLLGYIRTVARRQVAYYIGRAVQERKEHHDPDAEMPWTEPNPESPESVAIRAENARIIREVLEQMSYAEKRILELFYIKERTQQQICAEMKLTDTQYRLLKSRAKSRFAELGKVRVGLIPPEPEETDEDKAKARKARRKAAAAAAAAAVSAS